MPNSYFLIPGYGAQGGKAEDIALGFDEKGLRRNCKCIKKSNLKCGKTSSRKKSLQKQREQRLLG